MSGLSMGEQAKVRDHVYADEVVGRKQCPLTRFECMEKSCGWWCGDKCAVKVIAVTGVFCGDLLGDEEDGEE